MNRDELIPRSLGDIVENIDRFFVAEASGVMAGCASYQVHPELGNAAAATVEVQSLAVKGIFRRRGRAGTPRGKAPEGSGRHHRHAPVPAGLAADPGGPLGGRAFVLPGAHSPRRRQLG